MNSLKFKGETGILNLHPVLFDSIRFRTFKKRNIMCAIAGLLFKNDQTRNFNMTTGEALTEILDATGIRAIVSLPINIRGKVIGSLRIYHSNVWDISVQELSFLQVLTHNIGMALMYFRLSTAIQSVKDTVNDIHHVWL
ncbi:MAG: GAF domain-containing protein [Desulfamplus sp.]|nr:GAF domain-containing protein [Desulfamplus sp.]